jgi:cyclase
MKGDDLDMIGKVASSVRILVIASGGAGNYKHMLEAIQRGERSRGSEHFSFHAANPTRGQGISAIARLANPAVVA